VNQFQFENKVRINKVKARNLFNQGEIIHLAPCNLNPLSPWVRFCSISKSDSDRTFEQWVNSFEFYNCNSNEEGKYASFYIKNVEAK